jgi:PAS domain S-box-containing protein
MNNQYRVLQVEDCVNDAELNLHQLQRSGWHVLSQRVQTAPELKAALQTKSWDLILCDDRLPGFDALGALGVYKELGLDIPFIVVSGQIGEEQAVKLIKAGAHDFVMKHRLANLAPTVERELLAAQQRSVRKRAEATIAFLAAIVQHCEEAIVGETLDGCIVSWNAGAERLYGYSAPEVIGGSGAVLVPPQRMIERDGILEKVRKGERVSHLETVHLSKNRTPVQVSVSVIPVQQPASPVVGVATVAQDITERKKEERERLGLIADLTAALAKSPSQKSSDPDKLGSEP